MISKKQINHQKWLDAWLTDNFVFCSVFSDEELCKGLLERLLDLKIDSLTVKPIAEKQFKLSRKKKGIRLDIYAESEGKMYDIEIQTTNKKDLELRTRYYQGMMDRPALKALDDYTQLKESYILFICTFDPFNYGEACYELHKNLNDKIEWSYNDKTHTVFYNINEFAKETNKDKRNFLELLKTHSAKDDYGFKVLEMYEYTKDNPSKEKDYMTAEIYKNDFIYEGIAIGEERGAYNKAIKTAKKMLEKGFSTSDIVEITGLSEEEVLALK